MDILKDIVTKVRENLPQFNDMLIKEVRQNMIKSLPEVIDSIMPYFVSERIPQLTYHGYKEADPKQRALHIDNSDYYHADIQDSNVKLVIYNFTFETPLGPEPCPLYCYMPFLWEECFELNGTKYYPVFTICDKFISRVRSVNKETLNRYDSLGLPFITKYVYLRFRSKDRIVIRSMNNHAYQGTILKLNAHNNFKEDTFILPPALLYPFAKFGFIQTLNQYGIEPSQVGFTESYDLDDPDKEYFKVNDLIYLSVDKSCLTNLENRRFIVTLVHILESSPVPSIDFLYDPEATYFKFILGSWIQGENAPPMQKKNQAVEHLKTIDMMLDPISKEALHKDGIYAEDFYSLVRYIFGHIDHLLHFYEQNNLFEKRISILPQLMYEFVTTLNKAMFSLSKLVGGSKPIQPKDVKRIFKACERLLIRKIEQLPAIFMSPGDLSNDNWLLSIGARKYRLKKLKNPKNRSSGGAGSLRTDPTVFAHSSQPFVESISNLPASNPAIGGTMNIFFTGVDKNGSFHIPKEYEKHKDIYSNH